MKITATSSGGFAGLGEHYEIDTQASAQGRALEAVLDDSGFFAARAGAAEEVVGADLPRWQITASAADGRSRTVSFVEDGSPGNARWQNLVAQINDLP